MHDVLLFCHFVNYIIPLSIKFIVKVCSLLYYFRLFSNFIYARGLSDWSAAAIASILPCKYSTAAGYALSADLRH